MLWPAGDHVRFREWYPGGGQARFILGGWNQATRYAAAGVRPGDAIYPVHVIRGSLHLLTRLAVAEIVDEGVTEIVRGTLGFRYHLDLVVPPDVLERWRFTSRKGPRPIRFLENGRLTRSNSFQGIYRVEPDTASELFGLLIEHEAKQQLRTP